MIYWLHLSLSSPSLVLPPPSSHYAIVQLKAYLGDTPKAVPYPFWDLKTSIEYWENLTKKDFKSSEKLFESNFSPLNTLRLRELHRMRSWDLDLNSLLLLSSFTALAIKLPDSPSIWWVPACNLPAAFTYTITFILTPALLGNPVVSPIYRWTSMLKRRGCLRSWSSDLTHEDKNLGLQTPRPRPLSALQLRLEGHL